MDLVGIAEIVSAAAVLVGFGFAVSEVNRHRGARARESALALVRAYQTPEFATAILRLIELPEDMTREGLQARRESEVKLVGLLMTTWESLGILTFRREISLELIEDFFSGPVSLSWKKFGGLVREMRAESGRETYFEWFQWLAERMAERESEADPIPAHVEHRDWKER